MTPRRSSSPATEEKSVWDLLFEPPRERPKPFKPASWSEVFSAMRDDIASLPLPEIISNNFLRPPAQRPSEETAQRLSNTRSRLKLDNNSSTERIVGAVARPKLAMRRSPLQTLSSPRESESDAPPSVHGYVRIVEGEDGIVRYLSLADGELRFMTEPSGRLLTSVDVRTEIARWTMAGDSLGLFMTNGFEIRLEAVEEESVDLDSLADALAALRKSGQQQ